MPPPLPPPRDRHLAAIPDGIVGDATGLGGLDAGGEGTHDPKGMSTWLTSPSQPAQLTDSSLQATMCCLLADSMSEATEVEGCGAFDSAVKRRALLKNVLTRLPAFVRRGGLYCVAFAVFDLLAPLHCAYIMEHAATGNHLNSDSTAAKQELANTHTRIYPTNSRKDLPLPTHLFLLPRLQCPIA